ncbi:MlaE family ABC transporter permease [Gemmatimonas groenlandica]|uniref:ABC transporter permease n=1 Tax=Gemmatimonas groenlandica TaxID=2732249 RepID=A0A6M4ISZ0_9BACT|nr:ABC transporter permease [Gemmatimonas groenlandica]QJR35371.1 ABC transporter permease [Gemmatimonas groenlandica]
MSRTEVNGTTAALAQLHREGDALVVALGGVWSLEKSVPRFPDLVARSTAASEAIRSVSFDAAELGEWDSSLLIFLMQVQSFCEEHSLELGPSSLPEQVPRLLALAHAVPERSQAKEPDRSSLVARIGEAALGIWSDVRSAIRFTGEIAIALAGLPTRRVHMRWREFWVVIQTNSSGALPIVTLIALLVGVIIAFLGVVVLKRFGAGYYVSYLVGFGMLREMAALMTGIIIAGRTGAAFAAELGSMKITEEIDAYVTFGVSPIEHLVLPRFLGLFAMMPLLTIYADVVGITGGMLVSATLLDLSFKQFMSGLLSAVTLSDAVFGVFKGTIYGLLIAVAGCMKGLQGGSDASAVGRAATSAVVLGITLIILANAVVDWLAALLDI